MVLLLGTTLEVDDTPGMVWLGCDEEECGAEVQMVAVDTIVIHPGSCFTNRHASHKPCYCGWAMLHSTV